MPALGRPVRKARRRETRSVCNKIAPRRSASRGPYPTSQPEACPEPVEGANGRVRSPCKPLFLLIPDPVLFDARRIDQATIAPQRILPARNAGAGIRPEIAVEELAVIADGEDRLLEEVRREAEGRSEVALEAEDATDAVRLGGAQGVDIERGDPGLLGVDQPEGDPLHDLEPLVVALPHHRTEDRLADAFGQDALAARI